ncbi:MAG: hypothetical protein KAW12_07555, partial [Candidatus Aminicenantes bacterium]|nr:hypothetical protein [Candidatus Aminicenantes bacterium]
MSRGAAAAYEERFLCREAYRLTKVLIKLLHRCGMPLAPSFNLLGASPGRAAGGKSLRVLECPFAKHLRSF